MSEDKELRKKVDVQRERIRTARERGDREEVKRLTKELQEIVDEHTGWEKR